MAAPLRVEERLDCLEARMTAIEQLPTRMDRLESQFVDLRSEVHQMHSDLVERIEEARRETRVLFEETLTRISTIQEGLTGKRRKKSS
jgi:hypothetical protein